MPNKLEQQLSRFLRERGIIGAKLGVAVSGGPDSMVLLEGLRSIAGLFKLKLLVLHFDHAWRSKSAAEAADLQRWAEERGLPFLSERLVGPPPTSDMENAGRQARRSFFQRVTAEHRLDAIVLAQHADDQAETILKRLFEGANLTALGAMRPVREEDDLVLWRPLLEVRRNEILDYIQQRELPYIVDPTNQDPRFLRGRLRSDLLPALAESFGKEIVPGLCVLGERAAAVGDYLDRRIQPLLKELQWEGDSCTIPLERLPSEPLEAEQLLRRLTGGLPRSILAQILIEAQEPRHWQVGGLKLQRTTQHIRLTRSD